MPNGQMYLIRDVWWSYAHCMALNQATENVEPTKRIPSTHLLLYRQFHTRGDTKMRSTKIKTKMGIATTTPCLVLYATNRVELGCHYVYAMFLLGGGWCADVQAMERCDSALS